MKHETNNTIYHIFLTPIIKLLLINQKTGSQKSLKVIYHRVSRIKHIIDMKNAHQLNNQEHKTGNSATWCTRHYLSVANSFLII